MITEVNQGKIFSINLILLFGKNERLLSIMQSLLIVSTVKSHAANPLTF